MHSGYTFRTRALLKAQVANGWEVNAITSARHTAEGPPIETVDGLRFHRISRPAPAPSPLGEWREIRALAKGIAALVDEWRPDILHAHSPVLTALAASRVARRKRLPLIYEIRAFWEDAAVGNGTGREDSLRYRLIKALESHASRRADAVVVICEGLRRDLIARGIAAERIMVSPNGVDLALFGAPLAPDTALAASLGLTETSSVIGFIGSFYDYEGIDDLIAAMPALVNQCPDARLLLVGGGPMEGALRAQAQASPVASRICFVGRVPHDQVDRYYSLIDILAYPRKRMRLTDLVTPLKPLEAMAQRRLVAASDVGGHRELIEDGVTGTLFAPDDSGAIAVALADLLANRHMWETRRDDARHFVETERNWTSNISRYEPVYRDLINRKEMRG